jgi:hypothetical protein
LFLTQGDVGALALEFEPTSVHTVPGLAAFRARLSAPAQAEFDNHWDLMHDSEAGGTEIVLTLEQADESTSQALAVAMEREAVRRDFEAAAGVEDHSQYAEFGNWPPELEPTDLRAEAGHLAEIIETARAMLAMVLTHTQNDSHPVPDPRFGDLLKRGRPATAAEVYEAAGWEMPDTSPSGKE